MEVPFIESGGDKSFFRPSFPFFSFNSFVDKWKSHIAQYCRSGKKIEGLEYETDFVFSYVCQLVVA